MCKKVEKATLICRGVWTRKGRTTRRKGTIKQGEERPSERATGSGQQRPVREEEKPSSGIPAR